MTETPLWPAELRILALSKAAVIFALTEVEYYRVDYVPLRKSFYRVVASTSIRLLASFGRVFAQFLQKAQQCQPFVF